MNAKLVSRLYQLYSLKIVDRIIIHLYNKRIEIVNVIKNSKEKAMEIKKNQ